MVAAKTQYNLKNAESYFEEHLAVGDYYDEGQRVAGEWFGLGAERLGLSGNVRAADFLRLCENQNPINGAVLTQRLNTTRNEGGLKAANRRIFYDFTFSPPKSVSLAAFLGGDGRILSAHSRAVRSALGEFEAFAATRVRTGGAQNDRLTENFVATLFTHETSRALDPHLHTHCIVFNATFDRTENRWKALQNHGLLRATKFVENAYYHELARELRGFGYQIRNQARGDFEIDGISEEMCKRFSKRHAQIDEGVAVLLAKKPEFSCGDVMTLRRLLAIAERDRKQRELRTNDLRALWESQLTPVERELFRQLPQRPPSNLGSENRISLEEAVQWAEEHLFGRRSVVQECQVWQEALGRARGENFSVSDLKTFAGTRGYLRGRAQPQEITLREVLSRELEIIRAAKEGLGERHRMMESPESMNPKLDDEQREALNRLLRSTNLVSVFRGGAGTGKSFVLLEMVQHIQRGGRPVVVLAPQRQQVVDMEKTGFPAPATVTSFLRRPEIPQGGVIVVDEAGQIGGGQMLDLIRIVQDRKARLILSGDTRQHGPVEASDALVAIERYSGVDPVELHTIRRQDPNLGRDATDRRQISQYRSAVKAAASGKLDDSFRKLDEMGAVIECGLGEQTDRLADDYVRLTGGGASVVVVSQTWGEIHRVNSRVREALRASGHLTGEEITVETLEKLDLTVAQKRDARFYPPDALIVFNQKVREAEPGSKGKLAGILKGGALIEVGGRLVTVSNRFLDHITVCVPRKTPVSKGERLHVKANRRLSSGVRVTNGELVTVESVKEDGAIQLADGRVLDPSFREFLPGYAVTSYGSQGKTVDYVLFSDSTIKAATNAEQWYVSISRGRRGIRVFTPDKEQLRESIQRSGHRRLAVELSSGDSLQGRRLMWNQLYRRLLRFGARAANSIRRIKLRRKRKQFIVKNHERKTIRMLGE